MLTQHEQHIAQRYERGTHKEPKGASPAAKFHTDNGAVQHNTITHTKANVINRFQQTEAQAQGGSMASRHLAWAPGPMQQRIGSEQAGDADEQLLGLWDHMW